jgi:phosphoglycerate dehydrogenase-like enzyme
MKGGALDSMDERLTVVIASAIEEELVRRIAAAEPERVQVLYEPDLLPVSRYFADHDGIPRALSQADLDRWRGILRRADILLDFDWLDPASMPATAPNVRWVQATVSGVGDFLVRSGLDKWPVVITTAAGTHAVPLAEFVVLGLLYFVKQVPDLLRWQAAQQWERYTARSLAGRRVALIGLGQVGRQIAANLSALGLDVVGMGHSPRTSLPTGVSRVFTRDELVKVLREVDALVLACPYTPETHHLIGATEIRALQSHAIVVNVARGAVIDEPYLVEALTDRRIAGACLDVVEVEPLAASSPLWDMPNVLISPHSASTVEGENGLIADIFIDNLRRFLDGLPMRNVFVAARGY